MNRIIRFAALLMALLMILPSVFGCSDSGETAETTATPSASDTTAGDGTAEETREPLGVPEGSYFDGYTFTVFCRDSGAGGSWDTFDVTAAEYTGEVVNDAVYERMIRIEDTYGIDLVTATATSDALVSQAKTTIQAGDDAYDAILTDIQRCASLATAELLVDLNTVEYLDTSKPWWDTYVAETATIFGKLYFAMGDINIIDNSATWAVLFNKALATDYSLDDHYTLVNDYKWTIDKLTANSTTCTVDLDGNGTVDPRTDQWGTLNQRETLIALFAAGGGMSIARDSEGTPYICLAEDNMQQILDKVIAFKQNFDIQINADDYSSDWTGVLITPFSEGLGLYYISPLSSLASLREMEDELGIIPLPLISDTQSAYVSSLQYNNATAYCIPVTAADTGRTGIILEAMAYESEDTLTAAYYETTLKRKYSNDAESGAMLDLIFSTRVVDLGFTFDWGSMQNFMQKFAQKNANSFASEYAKSQKAITKSMENTLEKFQ